MSIRKVSDLPAIENFVNELSNSNSSKPFLFEVSQPQSIEESEHGKYLSRSISFDELVNAVKSRLSTEYGKWAGPDQSGVIRTGFPNDIIAMNYGLSTDSENRGFIHFEYEGETWTFTISGESGPQTVKKYVFASTITS